MRRRLSLDHTLILVVLLTVLIRMDADARGLLLRDLGRPTLLQVNLGRHFAPSSIVIAGEDMRLV